MLVSCFESKWIACRKSLLGELLHYVGSTWLSVTKSHWRHISSISGIWPERAYFQSYEYIIHQRNLTWENVFSETFIFSQNLTWERIFSHMHPPAESVPENVFSYTFIHQRSLTWEQIFSHIHPSAAPDLRTYFFSHMHPLAESDPENVFYYTFIHQRSLTWERIFIIHIFIPQQRLTWERIFIHIHPSAEFDLKSYFQSYSMNIMLPSADFERRAYFQSHSWRIVFWSKSMFSFAFLL